MNRNTLASGVVCGLMLAGCVSAGTHRQAIEDLEQGRKASVQTEAAFEEFKKQAAAERQKLNGELHGLQQEKSRLSSELQAAEADGVRQRASLETAQKALAAEQENRKDFEARFNALTGELKRVDQVSQDLRRSRDQLQNKVEDVQRRIETSSQQDQPKRFGANPNRILSTHPRYSRLEPTHIGYDHAQYGYARCRRTTPQPDQRPLYGHPEGRPRSTFRPAGTKLLRHRDHRPGRNGIRCGR